MSPTPRAAHPDPNPHRDSQQWLHAGEQLTLVDTPLVAR
jgi:hypothetical protein